MGTSRTWPDRPSCSTWNSNVSYDSTVESTASVTNTGWTYFDGTALVRHWVRGEYANQGVRVMPSSLSGNSAGALIGSPYSSA